MFMVYAYHAYNYRRGEDLYIYAPHPELSAAENILMMLREDRKYTALEAEILDMALVLHMDHGLSLIHIWTKGRYQQLCTGSTGKIDRK